MRAMPSATPGTTHNLTSTTRRAPRTTRRAAPRHTTPHYAPSPPPFRPRAVNTVLPLSQIGAKVQVAYYTVVLSAILAPLNLQREAKGRAVISMSDVGGIWLFGSKAPIPFGLDELQRMVSKTGVGLN